MGKKVGRNDPCPCGSGEKFKRCCIDAPPSLADSDVEVGRTLFVETSGGLMVRRIPTASPLSDHVTYGAAAELATHGAAAAWGLPDFVYLPAEETRGSGTRELGDGTIVVGDIGLALQVKGRETPSGDPEKERRWIGKKSAQALRQANGTIRALKAQPRELTSLRGRSATIDGNVPRWVAVVVLDHPDPPEAMVPSLDSAKHPAVVLSRADWEFLFDQLKSTYAVGAYLERVAGEPNQLGTESDRYYDCALQDSRADPEPIDPRLLALGGERVSTPMLPLEPAAHSDREAHRVMRGIMEEIATAAFTQASEDDRLRLLAELDRLPVGQRGGIGQYLMDGAEMISSGEWREWRLRSVRGIASHLNLGYGTLGRPHSDEVERFFQAWLQLHHYDLVKFADDPSAFTSVALLLTPPRPGRQTWDTTLAAIAGPISFTDDQLRVLREAFPSPARAPR